MKLPGEGWEETSLGPVKSKDSEGVNREGMGHSEQRQNQGQPHALVEGEQ